MRAVIGHNDQPTIITIRPPLPFPDEVLIKVHATALNRGDLLQVRGLYPQPAGAPETLGLELAGEIIGLGDNVSRWQIGDRVMALVAGGGYAEQAVVHQDHLMPIPAGFTYEQASAIPEAFLTAYSNMVQIGRLVAGERVLIHAGASGVGLSAIQIAKALGATVYTTVSAGKQAVCLEHGADQVIDYQTQNFADVILEQAPDGVNLGATGVYRADGWHEARGQLPPNHGQAPDDFREYITQPHDPAKSRLNPCFQRVGLAIV
jgi:NADPH:quinone reductase-like Zn-dependent oxidoreductase